MPNVAAIGPNQRDCGRANDAHRTQFLGRNAKSSGTNFENIDMYILGVFVHANHVGTVPQRAHHLKYHTVNPPKKLGTHTSVAQ